MENEEKTIKKFYIADAHFGHKAILHYDRRPWFGITEMKFDMIKLWNQKVRNCDEVYILGDFCFSDADEWKWILSRLHGKKYLIKGNHEPKQIPDDISQMFVLISDYMEVNDGDYKVLLSHYPIISYKYDSNPCVLMFHGHVHRTVEFEALKEAVKAYKYKCEKNMFPYQGKLYNCWCGFYGYMPASLKEILTNRYSHV
jgi:calcineurin-like phosphoesterase family protein